MAESSVRHNSSITTDTQSAREHALIRHGMDQARRAELTKSDILNCQTSLRRAFRR
jgi:hypothetical protein